MKIKRVLITKTVILSLLTTTGCLQYNSESANGGLLSNQGNQSFQLNEIDNYLLGLKKWEDISPTRANDPGSKDGDESSSKEGKYECTIQKYSLTTTPDSVVLFSGSPGELWPGSIIQAEPYLQGKFSQLPIADYAPIDLTIDLAITDPSVSVKSPSYATMQTAIGTLIERAKATEIPAEAVYNFKEAYSVQQLLLDFNLSAKYMNQNAKASLNINTDVETKNIAAYFVQKMFTVSVPAPKTPSSYFSDITMSDIKDQESLGRIGIDNPPLYVSSVTYGRVLLFTMSSTSSKTDIQAALDYAYKGGVDIDAKTKAKYKSILQNSEINVVPFGGPWKDAVALIRSANIKDYFSDTAPPLTTAVPISYKLNTLARGNPAVVSETTSYEQRDCHIAESPAIKKNAKFKLQYVGGGDNRYLSIAEWQTVISEAAKRPYPTLQLRPVTLQFRGNDQALTNGSNIRFVTLEKKAQGRKLERNIELGAWSGKKYVSYQPPQSGPKQNWIITKVCEKKSCDDYIRDGDKIHLRSQYKPKEYLCNDSDSNTHYLITKKAACTWKLLSP